MIKIKKKGIGISETRFKIYHCDWRILCALRFIMRKRDISRVGWG